MSGCFSSSLSGQVLSRLVHHLHLFFVHTATVHSYFGESSVDLTQVCNRQLRAAVDEKTARARSGPGLMILSNHDEEIQD
jgi:hypothetical protein